MSDLHLDGNGVAGLLAELAVEDMTSVTRTCPSCGTRALVGEHGAYRSAGVVLRCPACEDVAICIAILDDRLVVHWSGAFEIRRSAEATARA
jgi:hypothetical protein